MSAASAASKVGNCVGSSTTRGSVLTLKYVSMIVRSQSCAACDESRAFTYVVRFARSIPTFEMFSSASSGG